MALPEDDVEEVEPEDALARILDHEHDALVVGPGPAAGPRHGRARSAACWPRRGPAPRRPSSTPRRSARWPPLDDWWDGVRPAVRPDARTPGEFARLRAAQRRCRRGRTATCRRRRRPARGRRRGRRGAGARSSCSRAPGRVIAAPDGRVAGRRSRTRRSRAAAPATSWPGRSARLLAQGLAPFDGGPPRRLPPRHGRRGRPRAARRRRPARRRTCPTRSPSPASAWRRSPSAPVERPARSGFGRPRPA